MLATTPAPQIHDRSLHRKAAASASLCKTSRGPREALESQRELKKLLVRQQEQTGWTGLSCMRLCKCEAVDRSTARHEALVCSFTLLILLFFSLPPSAVTEAWDALDWVRIFIFSFNFESGASCTLSRQPISMFSFSNTSVYVKVYPLERARWEQSDPFRSLLWPHACVLQSLPVCCFSSLWQWRRTKPSKSSGSTEEEERYKPWRWELTSAPLH